MTTGMSDGAEIIILAAKTAEGRGHFTDEDQEGLEALLELRTLEAAGRDPDGALTIAESFPGYLVREVDDEPIFVPFNLAAVSPRLDQLRAAKGVACAIRLAKENALCLSGSAATLGKTATVSDLDFCEYHLGTERALIEGVQARTASDPRLVWVKRAADEKPAAAPWSDLTDLLKPPLDAIKLDFVSNSELGVLPTTTVVLKTTGEDGPAGKSFAYQEAVVAGAKPVRVLINPERLGAYIWWLKDEPAKLLKADAPPKRAKNTVKALKRCLSLYLMLESPDTVRDIVGQLANKVVDEVVLGARLLELKEMAEAMDSPPSWMSTAIDDLQDSLRLSEEDRAVALGGVEAFAQGLTLKIEALFEDVA